MAATAKPKWTAPHFLELQGARTINTEHFAETVEAIADDVVPERAIGVVYGEAGLGKSFATSYAETEQQLPVARLEFAPRTTMKALTERLLRQLTGVKHEGERFDLSEDLLDVLGETPRLVVVDEAQRLGYECIESLRWLHDQPETDFALILVGGNGCFELLCRYPMLQRRVYRWVEFRPLDPEDVVEIIPSYHPIYERTDPAVISLIDRSFAHGNFGHWAVFTKTAAGICERRDADRVTEQIARASVKAVNRKPTSRRPGRKGRQ